VPRQEMHKEMQGRQGYAESKEMHNKEVQGRQGCREQRDAQRVARYAQGGAGRQDAESKEMHKEVQEGRMPRAKRCIRGAGGPGCPC